MKNEAPGQRFARAARSNLEPESAKSEVAPRHLEYATQSNRMNYFQPPVSPRVAATAAMTLVLLSGACGNPQSSGSRGSEAGGSGASAQQSDVHDAKGGAAVGASSFGSGTGAQRASGGPGSSSSIAAGGSAKSGPPESSALGLGGATTPLGDSSQGGAATTLGDLSQGGATTPMNSATRGGATASTAIRGGATSIDNPTRGGTSSSSRTSNGTSPTGGGTVSTTTGAGGTQGERCDVGVWDGSTKPVPLSLSGNTFAHDPTMIEANGTFYRFWTGDRIPSAKSTNLTNWQDARAVFQNGYSAWVDEWLNGVSGETFNFPWAPDVSRFSGKYHIYSTFSAKFGDNISCITHLSTDDIATGTWTDHGPVICTKGSENYNAIDADVGIDAEGKPWLAFGSFWDGIMGLELDATGSRVGTSLTRLAWAKEIEAPVLFYRCGFYYLFVTWGLCCPGEGRSVNQLTYRVVVGRSRNIMGPYLDKSGKSMVDGGGTLMVQGDHTTWAAAGHSDVMVSGSKIYHLYHAYRQSNGEAQLRIVEMPFDSDQWPVPAGP